MSLFSFGTDKKKKKKEEGKKPSSKQSTEGRKKAPPQPQQKKRVAAPARDVLIRPLFTEKAVGLEEEGKYVFAVDPRTNKPEVRKAVEQSYGVTVTKVAIINEPAKRRRWRGRVGSAPGMKKAIVTLQEGQSIEIVSH